jgi:hypothetical protein
MFGGCTSRLVDEDRSCKLHDICTAAYDVVAPSEKIINMSTIILITTPNFLSSVDYILLLSF